MKLSRLLRIGVASILISPAIVGAVYLLLHFLVYSFPALIASAIVYWLSKGIDSESPDVSNEEALYMSAMGVTIFAAIIAMIAWIDAATTLLGSVPVFIKGLYMIIMTAGGQ